MTADPIPMTHPRAVTRVLLVEDNLPDARLLREMLRGSEGEHFELEIANRLSEAISRLRDAPFDVVLLDLGLPDSQGLETLSTYLESAAEIPVIVLTGIADDAISLQAVESGAQDYLVKGRIEGPALIRSIGYAIGRAGQETRRKRAEEEIKVLAMFPSENPDPVMRISEGGTLLYINESGSKQLPEWNLQVGKMAPPLLRDAVSQSLNDGSRKTLDLEYGERSYSFTVMPIRDGAYVNLYGRDISIRKRAEEALKESERKYRVLIENAGEAIFVAQDGVVKFPNPKALETTGYSLEELAGISLMELIHPDDRDMIGERYISRLRGGSPPPTAVPFRITNKSGEVVWVRGTAEQIDWEGNPGLLCFVRDITSEKTLESQFLQAQKMEAIGQLAGGIAHDFNNLLTVSIGYCDLALARIGDTHPLRRDLEEIRKASDRCAALTRQLLAFSRKQILEPKVINLGDVVADMDKMLQRLIREDIELVSVRGKDLWNVKADPGQIEQAIVNLVVNSRDAMPGGGKLTIEASNVVLDERYTHGHKYVPPGSYVRLAVSDTGHGMDEGTLARIFEPFFTTKEKGKGTGLGLSTVFGIVKQSGGHLNVYSEPGIGTAFKLYFPAVEETKTDISKAGALPSEDLRGSETVLVVEDEESVRQMVREVLEQFGYTVLEARSGSEAVDLCVRHEGTIHLVVTDVVMPGMSGVELSKRFAPIYPEMKVLFMSGYTTDSIVHQGILDPGVAFLHKPFTMYSLAYKVREVLGKA